MVRHHQPRKGSVAFSPRKRAAKETPRIKSWPPNDEPKLLGLAGYKVGMTHALVTDSDKNSPTNGMDVFTPVTVLEVPPVVVMGIRAYEKTSRGLKVITEVLADNLDEELSRKISLPKEYNKSEAIAKIQGVLDKTEDIKVLVHTNPKVTSVPKKKPDIFECGIGGANPEEKLNTVLELLGNEVKASDILNEGQFVDAIATTKGKGFQGVIKRHHQSRGPMGHGSMYHRRPGSMGSTSTPGRVFKGKKLPGHMGMETVTIQNLEVVRVDLDKNVILVKGSVPGNKGAILKIRNSVKSK